MMDINGLHTPLMICVGQLAIRYKHFLGTITVNIITTVLCSGLELQVYLGNLLNL